MTVEVMKAHIIVGSVGCVTGLVKSEKMSLLAKFFILDDENRVMNPKHGTVRRAHMYSHLPNGVQVMLFSGKLHVAEFV